MPVSKTQDEARWFTLPLTVYIDTDGKRLFSNQKDFGGWNIGRDTSLPSLPIITPMTGGHGLQKAVVYGVFKARCNSLVCV